MPRLIYGLLAAALVSLVVGFVVRTSTIPLLVSIGLSGIVIILILAGISRRLRQQGALEDPDEEALEDLEFIEETGEVGPSVRREEGAEATKALETVGKGARPGRKVKAKAKAEESRPEGVRPAVVKAKAAAAKSRPAAAKPKTKPGTKPTRVVVVTGRPRFHRRSCRFAKGKDTSEITVSTARKRGYSPCSVCDPA